MMGLFGTATERLCDKLDTSAAEGEDVEMESLFSRLTLDVIGKAVFNYDFDSLSNDTGIVEVSWACNVQSRLWIHFQPISGVSLHSNTWWIWCNHSNSYGHWITILLIIGFLGFGGPKLHAHFIHKTHSFLRSLLPTDYQESEATSKPLPRSRIEGQRTLEGRLSLSIIRW